MNLLETLIVIALGWTIVSVAVTAALCTFNRRVQRRERRLSGRPLAAPRHEAA
jgi:hypothetical protein